MAAVFPKRNEDGSFVLTLFFRKECALSRGAIENFISRWMKDSAIWIRLWKGGGNLVIKREELLWSDAYACEPRVISVDDFEIQIELMSTPRAVYWKDWMGKFAIDLTHAFPGIRLDSAKDSAKRTAPG